MQAAKNVTTIAKKKYKGKIKQSRELKPVGVEANRTDDRSERRHRRHGPANRLAICSLRLVLPL